MYFPYVETTGIFKLMDYVINSTKFDKIFACNKWFEMNEMICLREILLNDSKVEYKIIQPKTWTSSRSLELKKISFEILNQGKRNHKKYRTSEPNQIKTQKTWKKSYDNKNVKTHFLTEIL